MTLPEQNVPAQFRVPRPSIEFDKDFNISSFSLVNDKQYIINLFKVTCSCPDFSKNLRSHYAHEDIRRQCKHLLHLYKQKIGSSDLSEFLKCAFNYGYPLRHYLKEFVLDDLRYEVLVNYDGPDGWWIIFVKDHSDKISAYGYLSFEDRFPYEKPFGIITHLKRKLRSFRKQLKAEKVKPVEPIMNFEDYDGNYNGCVIIIFVLAIIIIWILF